MFCPKCGKENGSGNGFCFNCGSPLPVTKENGITNDNQTTNEFKNTITSPPPILDGNILRLTLSASGVIIAMLYLGTAFGNIPSVFSVVSILFGGHIFYGILCLACRLLSILSRVIVAAGLLIYALSRDDERDNTESLLLAVISCGILRIVLQFIAQMVQSLATFTRFNHLTFSFISFEKAFLYALLAIAIEVGLTYAAGYRPFLGKTTDELVNEFKSLPHILLAEMSILGVKYRQKSGQKQTSLNEGAYKDMNHPENGMEPMNENRSFLAFLLLGIITCGIYPLYVIYTFARDVNIICEGDGETTPGLLKLIPLTIVTCGVYSFMWYYKMLTRVDQQEKSWGIPVQTFGDMELGACWVLMKLVGLLISVCGIGIFVSCYADYLMFRNMNELSKEYNKRMTGQGSEIA